MKMESFFGENTGAGELKVLRTLLDAHRAVGVAFHTEDSASVTLVWPTMTDSASAPWIISEKVIGATQFKAILRTLFIESKSVKVLHHVGDVAHWMATHGLVKAASAVRNTIDLQLFYEHVVDPRERFASLTKILEEHNDKDSKECKTTKQDTPQELYRGMLSSHFLQNDDGTSTKGGVQVASTGNAAALVHTLLQPSVQRAHLCLICFDRVVTKRCLNGDGLDPTITMTELTNLTSRRLRFLLVSPGDFARIWFDGAAHHQARSVECLGDEAQLAEAVPLIKSVCDVEPLLALLPSRLYDAVMAVDRFDERITTLCLDVGRKPTAFVDSGDGPQRVELFKKTKSCCTSAASKAFFAAFSRSKQTKGDNLTQEELQGIIAMIGGEGKIDSSNRVCVDNQLHRISVIRSKSTRIIGLTMRVGRHLQFASNILLDLLLSTEHRSKSVLIVGKNGSGKTVLLRDIARCLSEAEPAVSVCAVDSWNDIGGDGSLPHDGSIGLARRMMVASLNQQAQVIIECIQNHAVDALLIDEIGLAGDVGAVAYAKRHCRRVIAGICCSDLKSLVEDCDFNLLLGGVETGKPPFSLFDDAAAKKQRKTKPLFDVVVELDETRRGLCRIVWDAAQAVDDLLRDQPLNCETRFQQADIRGVLVQRPSPSLSPPPLPLPSAPFESCAK